jgi:hypothetical protein
VLIFTYVLLFELIDLSMFFFCVCFRWWWCVATRRRYFFNYKYYLFRFILNALEKSTIYTWDGLPSTMVVSQPPVLSSIRKYEYILNELSSCGWRSELCHKYVERMEFTKVNDSRCYVTIVEFARPRIKMIANFEKKKTFYIPKLEADPKRFQ